MPVLPNNLTSLSSHGVEYRARNYQLEMLEHSLKRNIIVTVLPSLSCSDQDIAVTQIQMDTGSGKTHIAVLRIRSALERCESDKLVWFLGPTVALCTQQNEVLSRHLPAAKIRLLLGSDKVDLWGDKQIWDAALQGIHIVVSTYAILADALSHGYVTMTRLGLLVFDEAHHCARNHPANQIMKAFYHPTKAEQGSVPAILGLTASPIKSSKKLDLKTIEANLDSITITPRLHRQELMKHVHQPDFTPIRYLEHDSNTHACTSRMLRRLRSTCQQERAMIDITIEVGNLTLQSQLDSVLKAQKERPFTQEKFCADQLEKFYSRAQHIYEELGEWASNYFIIESIKKFMNTIDAEKGVFHEWQNSEKVYMRHVLAKIKTDDIDIGIAPLQISPKLECLISYLADKIHPNFSGLLFVQQRVVASILSVLLSAHPKTKDHFHSAPYVGLSNNAKRKQTIGELLDSRLICHTLADFKEKRKNLIVTTDVLEEGIDVTACNMVVCYNTIPTMKSFIQRRGRARQEKSTYAIMLASDDSESKIDFFQHLEEEMKLIYEDEKRLQSKASDLEALEEEVIEVYRVESSQACMTANSAMGHIYHFCNKLPRVPYVDLTPAFEISHDGDTDLVKAIVILPNSVNSAVRRTSGIKWWLTEREARKDAALQACKALHKAGLLSDNLLPFPHERNVVEGCLKNEMTHMVDIQAQFNPWVSLTKACCQPELHQTVVSIRRQSKIEDQAERLVLTTPFILPFIQPFELYWDSNTKFIVGIKNSDTAIRIESSDLELMRNITHAIVRAGHSDSAPDDGNDYVAVFTPKIEIRNLRDWLETNKKRYSALQQFHSDSINNCPGLIRNSLPYGIPHTFLRWRIPSPDIREAGNVEIQVECVPLTKRRNFLQPAALSNKKATQEDLDLDLEGSTPKGIQTFPAHSCTIDSLSFEKARFGLFIPPILQHFEVLMIATELQQKILKNVQFSKIDNVQEAITAPSAGWIINYQRYEFLGDSVLKFIISSQLFVDHPTWHEGYLSDRRSSIGSNTCLAKAASAARIDAFVITDNFKARKWRLPRISDGETHIAGPRNVHSKTLADVVEALIGAAYVDGGLLNAIRCIQIFDIGVCVQLPESWFSRNPQAKYDKRLVNLKSLVGYQFRDDTLLLEAITHPACETDSETESYQRLEFLGDAVLDMLLVDVFSAHKVRLSDGNMTMIRAAIVNAELLAFFCLEFALPYDAIIIEERQGEFFKVVTRDETALWKFMRHHSKEIVEAQQACLARHQDLRKEINQFLRTGKSYPWHLLAKLNPNKFFSDMIESIVGAIFVDSGGSLQECRNFAERIGLLPYLRRILTDSVNTMHPKNELGRLTGSATLDYDVQFDVSCRGLYQCVLKIDGNEVVKTGDVQGCLTKDEAIVRAADAALKLLSIQTPQMS